MKPPKDNIYVGSRNGGHVVIGHPFGACLIAFHCSPEEALDEFDERFGERVEETDSALQDYGNPGDTVAEKVDSAINAGDIRINDGGTTVWVDPHEWMRTFKDVREAMRCFLEGPSE